MTLDDMTTEGCNKAMEASVTILQNLGWTKEEILQAGSDWLLPRLRAECKARIDDAVLSFRDAMEAGMTAYATRAFHMNFVEAGIKIAEQGHSEFRGTDDDHSRMARLAFEK